MLLACVLNLSCFDFLPQTGSILCWRYEEGDLQLHSTHSQTTVIGRLRRVTETRNVPKWVRKSHAETATGRRSRLSPPESRKPGLAERSALCLWVYYQATQRYAGYSASCSTFLFFFVSLIILWSVILNLFNLKKVSGAKELILFYCWVAICLQPVVLFSTLPFTNLEYFLFYFIVFPTFFYLIHIYLWIIKNVTDF